MAMDVPTSRETEDPDEEPTTSALGFASTEAAESQSTTSIIDRIPRRHLLALGFGLGSISTLATVFLLSTLLS